LYYEISLIECDIYNRQRLRINAKGGELAAIVLPDMPSHLRSKLMVALKLVFPDLIKYMDSKELGEKFTYPGLHFFWYNKYCLQVCNFRGIALILTKNLQHTNVENRLELAKVDWSKCQLQCHI
jgi:hypothetical protein